MRLKAHTLGYRLNERYITFSGYWPDGTGPEDTRATIQAMEGVNTCDIMDPCYDWLPRPYVVMRVVVDEPERWRVIMPAIAELVERLTGATKVTYTYTHVDDGIELIVWNDPLLITQEELDLYK